MCRVMRFLAAILGLLSVASAFNLGHDRDLTHDQLMALLRPSLSPMVQGMLDEIEADPILKRLNELTPWERTELAVGVLMKNSTYRAMIMEDGTRRMKRQAEEGRPVHTFPCKPLTFKKAATSVHELTPLDITVVGAMGDSLTAGNGIDARTVLGVLLEYRGEAWSIGGQRQYESNPVLPNILHKYNTAGISGSSTGICKVQGKCSHLNVAIPGKTARDMPAQARDLISRMKADPTIDFKNHWKMVTIFIGQNDICSHACKKPSDYTVSQYRKRLADALDILFAEMPRTFVNLVSMVDAYECRNLNAGAICTALHLYECPCAGFGLFYKESKALNDAYQREIYVLADDAKYASKSDFVVVAQPFFQKTNLPRTKSGDVDLSYFAPDCFHFSAKGHAAAALSLWNSMFEPVGKKSTSWHVGEPLNCPTAQQPYFCTKKNCGRK